MNPIVKYFEAEKMYCWIGLAVTVLTIGLALTWLFRTKLPFYNGVAWPFLIFGIFLLLICIGVIIRSPKDIQRVSAMIENNRSSISQEEIPRMDTVMRNFKVIIVVEIVLIALAGGLMLFASLSPLWRGVATGVLYYAAFLLAFDLLAQHRGSIYLEFLKNS
jgi:hypothetical protein